MNKEDNTEDESEDLSSKRKTKAGIVISAKAAGSVKLVLTYGMSPLPSHPSRTNALPRYKVVSGARWSPAYELHASTDSTTQTVANTVTLHYRASVVQTTGENWDDVNLTLSTAPTLAGTVLPLPTRSVIREATAVQNQNQNRGLFGATNVNSTQAQAQAQVQRQQAATSSLFGQARQPGQLNPQQSASTSGFGFGSASSIQPTSSLGAFGATPSATTSGGLFGSTVASAGPTGLFGASASTAVPTAATGGLVVGGGLFGQAATQPHQHQSEEQAPEPQSPVIVASDPELQVLEHAGTESQERMLARTYKVDTPVAVQSDGTPHRVTIVTVQLEAKTEYVAVPKTMPTVFLQVSSGSTKRRDGN